MSCNCNCHFVINEKKCKNCHCNKYSIKQIKKLISDKMTNRRKGISVMLGECDSDMDRIHIKFPIHFSDISLNPIREILERHHVRVAQVIQFWFADEDKNTILLIRDRRNDN